MLLEHGANVLLVDDLGFTPVDVATGSNVQFFLKGICKILDFVLFMRGFFVIYFRCKTTIFYPTEAWTEHAQRFVDSGRVKSGKGNISLNINQIIP